MQFPQRNYPPAPVVPDGMVAEGPDIAVLGAQKCGTTRLWELFRAHPQFHLDDRIPGLLKPSDGIFKSAKERMFFEETALQFSDELGAEYRQWFPKPPGCFTADLTPYNLALPWVPRQFFRASPKTRLVAVLRDPVKRFVSGCVHVGRLGGRVLHWHYYLGLYFQQIERWLQYFPRESLLVVQFEQFNRDPGACLRRILRHCGVDDTMLPQEEKLKEHVLKGREKPAFPSDLINSLQQAYRPDARRLFRAFPDLEPELWGEWLDLQAD